MLTEMLVDTYIPNDTEMGSSSGRVHIITGLRIHIQKTYQSEIVCEG